MSPVRFAVILLIPPPCGIRFLLRRDIAGIPLFKRLVLTLQRAGLSEIAVLSREVPENEIPFAQGDLQNDPRFQGKLHWFDVDEILHTEGWKRFEALAASRNFLWIRGDTVTSPRLIREFIRKAETAGALAQKEITVLESPGNPPPKMYLFPAEKLEKLKESLQSQDGIEAAAPVLVTPNNDFAVTVRDAPSVRLAEVGLIRNSGRHYKQVLDRVFNALFSKRISSLLVKTPLTPNQVTLMGLPIGLCSGWFFSWGNYWGGLLGALLLVGTAIWDCCDGDVARLKLMESDFGDSLDTTCDNVINVFAFIGMMLGVAHTRGWAQALAPFLLLALGGVSILILIYFPRGAGKGGFFKGTRLYDTVQILASRNFIHIILLFAIFGRVDLFLWLAGFGSCLFALVLFLGKRKILLAAKAKQPLKK
ncbi:MAG: CDP-alcohol phosphatidyltransferase family protein [Nitrospinaceae bacterium]